MINIVQCRLNICNFGKLKFIVYIVLCGFFIGKKAEQWWKDLLDTFRCKYKPSGSEGDSVKAMGQCWRFYDRMSFLRPYMHLQRE